MFHYTIYDISTSKQVLFWLLNKGATKLCCNFSFPTFGTESQSLVTLVAIRLLLITFYRALNSVPKNINNFFSILT